MATTNKSISEQAAESWQNAGKVRKHLMKQVERLKEQSAGGVDFDHLHKIDSELGTLRLACMHTIFLDFEYATEQKAEQALWGAHTAINSQYRRILSDISRARSSSNAVEKRKFEKAYQNFLRVAQKFYVGYVQRIANRYDIKELKRLARVIDVDESNAADLISPVPEKLYDLVLRSCHATLIRLGDLGRYRVLAKPKKTGGFETAMGYYSLAHDLIPTSGFGLHQMAIINIEEGNNLDTIYHFYRAWVTAESHPMAKSNLEAKFKDIIETAHQTEQGRRRSYGPSQVSATPRDAFSRWFLQLHALYYRGEPFEQQGELENEVVHRLEQLTRAFESAPLLLKASFISLAAFHVASKRYAEDRTETALRFCQFTMGLNAKVIICVSETLRSELATIARARAAATDKSTVQQIWMNTMHLLPLLRLYMIWLAAQRIEIFGAPEAAPRFLSQMMQGLSRTVTLLCDEAACHEGLSVCPYLLSEDIDMIGFQPLDSPKVPEACRSSRDNNGDLKPFQESQNASLSPYEESLARMLDTLRTAYFLAEDPLVPLSYHVTKTGLVFEYQSTNAAAHSNDPALGANSSKVGTPKSTVEMPPPGQHRPGITSPPQEIADRVDHAPSEPEPYCASEISAGIDGVVNQDEQLQNTVMSMLSPFMKPPTPSGPSNARSSHGSSYGMHSATAEEVFASYSPHQLGQGSPGNLGPSKTFEQLPWKYFHTPTPRKADLSADPKGSGQLPVPALSPRRVASDTHPSLTVPTTAQTRDGNNADPMAGYGVSGQNMLPSSSSGVGRPRVSQFAHWSPEHGYGHFPPGSTPSATSPQQPVPHERFAHHMSNMSTSFSQNSSLFHGTPYTTGGAFSRPAAQETPGGPPPGSPYASSQWRSSRNDTASSYDAAVFNGAMRNG